MSLFGWNRTSFVTSSAHSMLISEVWCGRYDVSIFSGSDCQMLSSVLQSMHTEKPRAAPPQMPWLWNCIWAERCSVCENLKQPGAGWTCTVGKRITGYGFRAFERGCSDDSFGVELVTTIHFFPFLFKSLSPVQKKMFSFFFFFEKQKKKK